MRISDWSSDVCSSDLPDPADLAAAAHPPGRRRPRRHLRQLVRRRLPGPAQPDLQLRGGAELPRPLSGDRGVRGRARGLRQHPYRGAGRRGADEALRLEGRAEDPAAVDHLSQQRRQQELRSEEHTSELQSLMRTSYAVFSLKKKKQKIKIT